MIGANAQDDSVSQNSMPPKGVDPFEPAIGSAFDLSHAVGETESERVLARLCKDSFLSLWSYPNTFTDEGIRPNKRSGKEFADVLVVFGDDIIIFSDKHIRFNNEIPVEVAWPRWFKSAVSKSVRQLYGAMNWAKNFPTRIYQDAACTRTLPIDLPPSDRARYHLVATTRGSFDACANIYEGSLGSHLINTSLSLNGHASYPFNIGRVAAEKHFVHVLDEFSLEAVMRERDTAVDFIDYLKAREEFLSNPDLDVMAAGEEQLLASYMTHMREGKHWFLSSEADVSAHHGIWFDESHWDSLHERPEYKAKKKADRISYFWDELVDRFITEGNPLILGAEISNRDLETALRIMASKSRFERKALSEAWFGVMKAAEATPNMRRFRLASTLQEPSTAYVFMVDPMPEEMDYIEYRRNRSAALQTYLHCAPLQFPQAKTFIGLAFDHPIKNYAGSSEDLAIYRVPDNGNLGLDGLREIADQIGILSEDLVINHSWIQDFPEVRSGVKGVVKKKRPVDKKRNRKKSAKLSRQKNRKK